jgi:hypothetical protein
MPHRNDMENIFHMYMDEVKKRWNVWMKMECQWTFWMINACRRIVWMKDSLGWNVWMKLIPKQLCWMKTTCTWMIITKNMKYLDEREARMNFWMIIGSRWIVESNSKTITTNGNYWIHKIFMSNFIWEKNVKGETQRSYIIMQKGEIITCVN